MYFVMRSLISGESGVTKITMDLHGVEFSSLQMIFTCFGPKYLTDECPAHPS